jgi:S-DNA-T family DNA segregation ATPase FtsK/SpoIIIE
MPLKSPFKKSGSKPASKSAPKGKAPARRPDVPAGKPAGQAAQKKPAGLPASRPAGAKPVSRRTAAPVPPPPPLFNLSDERKLDVLGVGLALGGVLMLLALISANHDTLIGAILDVFSALFGWGTFILPVVLILFGTWLVLRKIERIPSVSIERISGLLLLFFFTQTLLQGIAGNPEPGYDGGGWTGSLIYNILEIPLGLGGLVVAMSAWLLIALIMAFDLTLPELFVALKPVLEALARLWARLKARIVSLTARPRADAPTAGLGRAMPIEDGYTPLNPASGSPAQPGAPAAGIGVPTTTVGKQVAWVLPKVKDILEVGIATSVNQDYIEQRARLLEETLASFGAPAQVVEINRGPTITQFGMEPLFIESRAGRMRVRVSKIVSLADDLALALAAPRIRIQAPVPGRSYLGIEVPNDEMTLVTLRDILETDSFERNRRILSFALGRDVSGHPAVADLAAMPHLLIAGATGSGKSVCVNAILTSLLLYNTPDELRLILVDPKRVELTGYNGIPHLLSPVVVEMDRVIGALQWMTREMDRRYHTFAQVGARNIQDYNTRIKTQGGGKALPYLVVVIDELADLMMIAPDETERTITRLAQLARATGIHIILATQRPSVDVVTGLIKANFPARIAFAVASNTDSRVILDQPGAERLLGRGDMLYQSQDAPSAARLQGVFVSDVEIHKLVDFWREQNTQAQPATAGGPVDTPSTSVPLKQTPLFEDMARVEQGDPLFSEAVDLIRREGRASVSMLQRKMRIGYTRAARLIDQMEEKKIVGTPQDATGVRPVLDYGPAAPPKET